MRTLPTNELLDQLRQAIPLDASIGFDAPDISDPPVKIRAEAAVLILINLFETPSITLTVRQDNLRKHAGQISFPGGRQDKDDISSWHTARREATEEIGLPSDHILENLGKLPAQRIISGFRVSPHVAINQKFFDYTAQNSEVSEIFDLPLESLHPKNFTRDHYVHNDQARHFHILNYRHYRIWGATARMLFNLANRLEYVRN